MLADRTVFFRRGRPKGVYAPSVLKLRKQKIMGYNRIWYALLWIVLILLLIPIAHFDYSTFRLVLNRWSWGIVLSPAAYVYFSSLVATIFFPVKVLALVPVYFDRQAAELYSRRYKWTLLTLTIIAVGEFVILVLIWGAFPLEVDSSHYVRLRLIPFFPWPDREFLTIQ